MRKTLMFLAVLCLTTLIALPSYARRGADDPPGDDRGGLNGGGADDNGGGNQFGWIGATRARAWLVLAEGASDADAKGWVEIRSDSIRERLAIEVEHLDAGATVRAELASLSGDPIDLGSVVADLDGKAKYEFDTHDGDVLPGGASKAADLVGFGVTVFDAGELDLLTGVIPDFGSPAKSVRLRARVAGSDDPGMSADLNIRAVSDRKCSFGLKLKGLAGDSAYSLWIEDPLGSGEMIQARQFLSDSRGQFRLRLRAEKGDDLPAGASCAADFAGLRFEIRDGAGDAVLSGTFPTR